MCIQYVTVMKNKQLRLRMSERRFNKLQSYALYADKTMTQVVEELIDSLPTTENGNSSSTNIAD
ncbi:MAG: hypothetical protein NVS2B14_04780 [Chamaesiphon sp.]